MTWTVLESVEPALMWTGDVTVAFAAGVQMVTEGLAEFRAHDAVAACKTALLPNKKMRQRKRRAAFKSASGKAWRADKSAIHLQQLCCGQGFSLSWVGVTTQ
jgi:hypothetical protein